MHKTSRSRRFLLCAAVLAAMVVCPSIVQAGQINGSVQDADGKPLGRVSIVINIEPSGGPTQPFSTVVSTAADGTFIAAGIPNGKFVVCPRPTNDLLSPCAWETTWPTVTVTQGQTVTMAPIRLKRGIHLSIRVDDPTGKRAAQEGKVPGASFSVEVVSPNGFVIPATAIRVDGAGRDHDILIPFDVNLQLRAYSKVFAIADAKGAPVDKAKGASVPILVRSGTTPAKVLFTITGVN